MNVALLIDAIVRQTTVLIAQLATAGGARTPLSDMAGQVFRELADELHRQGVSRKVAADMFGMALRTYRRRIQRFAEIPDPVNGCEGVNFACAGMDAASNDTLCGVAVGYTWNGSACEVVMCGCTGTDCDALYPSLGACVQAHLACYGAASSCERPSDCTLTSADCCGTCGVPTLGDYVAVASSSLDEYRANVCGEPIGCLPCVPQSPTTFYATCSAGGCAPIDVAPIAGCTQTSDCELLPRDCCPCGADLTDPANLVAVSDPEAYRALVCEPGQICPEDCAPNYGANIAVCDTTGVCVVEPSALP